MKKATKVVAGHSDYFTGYFIFLFTLTCFCLMVPKSDGFLLINQFHCKIFDNFFILFTNLGDGLFAIAIMLFMLIRRRIGWSLQIAVSFLITGLIVQVVKQMFHMPRPQLYFPSHTIHLIHGITGTGHSSFPSGHTATIFALVTLLAFYFPGRKQAILFILLAVLTGFSRIYLSQHFPVDVLVGSAIGVMVSTLTFLWVPLESFKKKFVDREPGHRSAKWD
ncbi:MAG: phosphatase PAP2 family protein [Bacteroidota bacterium]|nr:phosphatase PAP2 family protein [Bacteroidota bacterium]